MSLFLTLFVAAIFAALIASVWWGAKKYSDWTDKKRKLVCGSFLVAGLICTPLVYVSETRMRAITLFETMFEWEATPEKRWRIDVEHTGVEHTFHLQPELSAFREAAAPVTLHITLTPENGVPLLDETLEFDLEKEYSSGSRSSAWRHVWDGHSLRFTPERFGIHILEVEAIGGYPPHLFLRIEDPLKRDGKRAPGY